ncbi:MAG: tRNA pseudouridine(55) synthase TruB [Deltaproteobacteria bacterium]|nr:tRNA pseudouridine(55) synthase TruB [Deltaproteobacteria bacterium]
MPAVHGVLLIDKPEGMTSAAVVREVKRTLGEEKVGHLGTLDPFSSGLLPICLGSGTKISQFLMVERKAYSGTIRLGVETDTFDSTGTVTKTLPVPPIDEVLLRKLETQFTGEQWQTPPMYSAIKQKGVPLYKLARQGIEVEREPRQVTIERLNLTKIDTDLLSFSLHCSKGTYVRSFAVDLGTALGCGAHLATLRRTEFGPFSVEHAVLLSLLATRREQQTLPLLSVEQALRHYRAISISVRVATMLRQGKQAALGELDQSATPGEIAQLLNPQGELVAMVQFHGEWKLLRVFATLQ